VVSTLDSVFAPLLERISQRINQNLGETTPAGPLLDELEDQSLAIRIERSALAVCLSVQNRELVSSLDIPDEPDVVIEGPLSGLLKMATADGDMAALAGSGVRVSGRADMAQAFQKLIKLGKPDLEEELAGLVGDAAAYQLGQAAERVFAWGRNTRRTLMQNASEYLTEERRDLPSRYEMTRFTRNVQTLRDDVERAEARLRRLEDKLS